MSRISPAVAIVLGMLMFIFGGIGGEAMWKIGLAIVIAPSVALVIDRYGRLQGGRKAKQCN
ncbi:hypothetical protein MML63_19025 [Kosakonia sacchari]|uniref:hypothetical protein n=1 Tax=Kosakonia sacchari TaxID=1158459 RepID=UPI0025B16E12|nr:hypothetical protein [Kosakonia sacchari]MDN2487727.1 hypothetical protein [Kosakonia sacchari]